jgi:hypothetical protein
MRQDATIIVDECHNFLHLPVGMDDALAEARGYRISLVLAHQHLAQLPADVAHAVDANARNKIYFTVSPDDARHLARHTAPVFDDYDLSTRPAFHASVRVGCPAFFGQVNWCYFMPLPAESGTHPGPLAVSGTRVQSEDASDCTGAQ